MRLFLYLTHLLVRSKSDTGIIQPTVLHCQVGTGMAGRGVTLDGRFHTPGVSAHQTVSEDPHHAGTASKPESQGRMGPCPPTSPGHLLLQGWPEVQHCLCPEDLASPYLQEGRVNNAWQVQAAQEPEGPKARPSPANQACTPTSPGLHSCHPYGLSLINRVSLCEAFPIATGPGAPPPPSYCLRHTLPGASLPCERAACTWRRL